MGLISKVAMVKWNPANRKHYESKGYTFTKWKDEFECKVEDLSKGSNVYVDVRCDCEDCKTPPKPIIWTNYNRYVKEDGKYYCTRCTTLLFGSEKSNKTKMSKSMSFSTWLIKNLPLRDAINIIARWDDKKNKKDIRDVNCFSTGIKNMGYYFKCLKHKEHISEQKRIGDFVKHTEKRIDTTILECNQCNSFGQYLLDTYEENAIDLYWSKENSINPFEISKGSGRYILINCQEKDYHGCYPINPKQFIDGHRCSYCKGMKVHPLDSIGRYLEDNNLLHLWSDKNEKSPYEYSNGSAKEVRWKCPDGKHNDFYRGICVSRTSDFRCPDCSNERKESILQEKVRLYLESLGMGEILHENRCTILPKNPKTTHNNTMPYDNEIKIKETKLIIESNGIQHYEVVGWHTLQANKNNSTPEYELHYQKLKDRYKRIYAKMNGYHYLEIPYWTDNNQEEWKQLIDNKIQEILSQQSQSA